ncbi:hypothetical protein [Flavobacterium sp.]|uniref:hypothetical protein n=1 Tax=Flavobacterium sp. TaxID=239 RepID=UPI003F69D949
METYITREMEIVAVNTQLKQLKRYLGLNILELAAILRVSRPTIYKWMETEEINVRQVNQERLNRLYEIGKAWKAKKLGRLGSYLHKPLGQSSISLFSLLKRSRLYSGEINRYLDNIAQLIIAKRQENEAHEALLKKHGFEPMSKEDMEDSLNDIDFMD